MACVIAKHGEEMGMTLGEIQATFMVLTTAGSETTATALSGTLSYLVKNPEMVRRLTDEVGGAFGVESDISFSALSELPYLNTVLSEGLQQCPPIPVMLPRLVPPGGDTVCGVWLPGGVSIHHI